MPSRFLCPKATGWSLPAACNDHNRSSPECFPHSGDVFLIREKPSPLAGLFMERVTSLRRLVPLALLWLHCRPAGNARQSTGLSDSIVRASSPAKKAQPFGWTFYGAGDEARTRYLHLGKVALYRMSYTRGTRLIIAEEAKMSRTFSVWAVFLLKTAARRRR